MRIITGKHRGRKIEIGPDNGKTIRPTSDMAREAIFNILTMGKMGNVVEEANVLDLYCGTGALGLEALSRGASRVTFVDKSRDSIAIARYNTGVMKEEANTSFLTQDGTQLGRAREAYSLVFVDPPYSLKLIEPSLKSLVAGGWLADEAVLVLEHDEKDAVTLPESFELLYERRYGRASIKIVKYQP